jgi:hypothetical protein
LQISPDTLAAAIVSRDRLQYLDLVELRGVFKMEGTILKLVKQIEGMGGLNGGVVWK